ncbi:RluA family pseudouridine synthase [Virgibacillus xinjiangensis]|uniref:Pseudouridine synthase n=1 Tax=Virgibacillus xinjiangensis TaxID=393090 RepID=A0ABV7CVR5_9BACI
MKWIIEEGLKGMTIRDYLQQVHGFSRAILKAAKFDGGTIKVNGREKTVRFSLSAGDELEIVLPAETIGQNLHPVEMHIPILFEDDDIVIIDKPAGVPVMPSYNHPVCSIANGLLGYYQRNQIPYTIHVVTRLDRDTSGLMLVAKHRLSHSLLSASQKAGNLHRMYHAVVEGFLEKEQGTIDAPIGRKEGSIIERTVTSEGKKAVTHYRTLASPDQRTLVEVNLETGRTHQIRVHFAHIGHPLAGDDLYGGSSSLIGRQALHCVQLEVEHPATKKQMIFTSSPPGDMKQLISR